MDINKYISAYKFIINFYQKALRNSQEPFDYVSSRISLSSITKYKLGYSPDRYSLSTALSSFLPQEDILSLGIFHQTEQGLADRFHRRIIFPIFSTISNPIGITGRTISDSQFKYLLSSDTSYFRKSEALYNFNFAIHPILRDGYVFLVEGLFDVIAMQEAGFNNTVASLGTTVTKEQLKSLRLFTDNLVILFDGDSAGQSSSMVTQTKANDLGFNTFSIPLPISEDPASLYSSIGIEPFRNFILSNFK